MHYVRHFLQWKTLIFYKYTVHCGPGTHWNHFSEAVLMSIHDVNFHEETRKKRSGYPFYIELPYLWDTLSTDHTCPKIWNSPFCCLLMCPKYCCMFAKQCRPWSDAAFCSIWSGSTLFVKACMSQFLELLRYYSKLTFHLVSLIWPLCIGIFGVLPVTPCNCC